MTHSTSPPRRTPILIKTVTTLVLLALVASILVPQFTLLTASLTIGIYLALGLAFSYLPTLTTSTTA